MKERIARLIRVLTIRCRLAARALQRARQRMAAKRQQARRAKQAAAQRQLRKVAKKKKSYYEALERNPYLQSRALWNDMYGEVQTRYENARRLNWLLGSVIAVCVAGYVVIAGQSKVTPVPFLIHGNDVFTVTDTSSHDFQTVKGKIATFFTQQFIREARSVSADRDTNMANRIAAIAKTAGAATHVLHDFYQHFDPDTVAKQVVKSVEIKSLLHTSPTTFSVRWRETVRNVNTGEKVAQHDYIAQLTYGYGQPSENRDILKNNPMGFVITQLSWTNDQ